MSGPSAYPAVLANLVDSFGRCLVAAGVGAAIAEPIAADLVEHIRTSWGGRNLYINRRQPALFEEPEAEAGELDRLLRDVAGRAAEKLVDAGLPEGDAPGIAADAVARFQAEWGRENFYLPKGRAIESDRQAQEIWAQYNGRNARALARKLGLSDRRVQQIVEVMRDRTVASVNLRLFEV